MKVRNAEHAYIGDNWRKRDFYTNVHDLLKEEKKDVRKGEIIWFTSGRYTYEQPIRRVVTYRGRGKYGHRAATQEELLLINEDIRYQNEILFGSRLPTSDEFIIQISFDTKKLDNIFKEKLT